MMRQLIKLLGLAAMVIVGGGAVYIFQQRFSANFQIRKLEDQNHQLQQVVQRLNTEKRVAEMLVTDQQTFNGVVKTTLLFVEYAADGSSLTPKTFTIDGDVVHVDALVIKFDHDFVQKDDPLRGHSIALFTKIYGDHQKPVDGADVDPPGKAPDIYRGQDAQLTDFEKELWENFWKLADDPAYRQEKGVRVANGEGPWRPVKPDVLYTLTLETNGGLNLTSAPVQGIYREALKHRPVG